ncbi:hypothetical protein D3C76_681790 [compost metagenome]
MLSGNVALQVLVVDQIFGRMLIDVGVDVLGGLLAADAEALHQMIRRQASFPPSDSFNQLVPQRQIPAHSCNSTCPFHEALHVLEKFTCMRKHCRCVTYIYIWLMRRASAMGTIWRVSGAVADTQERYRHTV